MNVILDIVIVAIAVLSIVFAVKRGFIKTLLSGSAFLLALLLTIAFVAPVRDILKTTPVYDGTRDAVSSWVSQTVTNALPEADAEEPNAEELESASVGNEDLFKLLSSLGIDIEGLKDEFLTNCKTDITEAVTTFASSIAVRVADFTVSVIAAVSLFVVSLLLLLLLSVVLTNICKLPILKQANALLGGVLGAVLALVRIFAFVSLIRLLIPIMQTSTVAFFNTIDPANTLLFGIFYGVNLFAFL